MVKAQLIFVPFLSFSTRSHHVIQRADGSIKDLYAGSSTAAGGVPTFMTCSATTEPIIWGSNSALKDDGGPGFLGYFWWKLATKISLSGGRSVHGCHVGSSCPAESCGEGKSQRLDQGLTNTETKARNIIAKTRPKPCQCGNIQVKVTGPVEGGEDPVIRGVQCGSRRPGLSAALSRQ